VFFTTTLNGGLTLLKRILGMIYVLLLIIGMYVGIFALGIVILHFVPFFEITIRSWLSVLWFSLLILLWILPAELIENIKQLPDRYWISKFMKLQHARMFVHFVFFAIYLNLLTVTIKGIEFSFLSLLVYSIYLFSMASVQINW
jgi:hypothetical protein